MPNQRITLSELKLLFSVFVQLLVMCLAEVSVLVPRMHLSPEGLLFTHIEEQVRSACSDTISYIRGTQGYFPHKYTEDTLQAIQSTFGSVEIHSKWRYKICICSVILGELIISGLNGTVIQKFLAVLKLQKILGNICFSEQIFYKKQSLGAPEKK